MLTKQELGGRAARLGAELSARGIDGAIFAHPIDLYYFTGTRQNGIVYVPAAGEPVLLVRKSYARAREEALVTDVRPFPSSKELPQLFAGAGRIGFTFDVLPHQQYLWYAKMLEGKELVDISAINRDLRSVKSQWELERMAEGGRRLSSVFGQVPQFLKAGMREVDLAAEFEHRLRTGGSEGYVRMRAFNQELFQGLAVSDTAGTPGFFDGAVTGKGMSAAAPHGASADIISGDAPVLIDYTGIYDGYILDMTRMFALKPLESELQRAFGVALSIQRYLEENLKPGAICEELFAAAASMAEGAGLAQHFMGAPGENARFVGHGVGLELDEMPVLAQGFKAALKVGQTIAIEPKFVFPGRGVVGIENTFAVTEAGGRKLTDLPDDLVVV